MAFLMIAMVVVFAYFRLFANVLSGFGVEGLFAAWPTEVVGFTIVFGFTRRACGGDFHKLDQCVS